MPRFVCSLDGKFFEFSTVVEAPVSTLMTAEEFEAYYLNKYGEAETYRNDDTSCKARMERALRTGTSDLRYGENTTPIEEWLRSETLNTYGSYDDKLEEETGDGYVSKWPGLEAFKQEWFGSDDGEGEIVKLEDLEVRALGAVKSALEEAGGTVKG